MYVVIFFCVFRVFGIELFNIRIEILIVLFIIYCNVYLKDFDNVVNIIVGF